MCQVDRKDGRELNVKSFNHLSEIIINKIEMIATSCRLFTYTSIFRMKVSLNEIKHSIPQWCIYVEQIDTTYA